MLCCYADPEALVDPESFYPIRPECKEDAPPTRFKPMPGKTLSSRRWHASFSPDGQLDISTVIQRIQRGGVHPKIKGEVWEFLLSCYDPNTTLDQRNELRQSRRLEYEKLKSKCKEMEPSVGSGVVITMPLITEDGRPVETLRSNNGPESVLETQQPEVITGDAEGPSRTEKVEPVIESEPVDAAVVQWKLTLHQIGLDVVRTDRSLVYYEDPLNRSRLWDLLAIYSWIDRDIGYCQGMSDLCSPISILIENEADAFWCFERLMRRLRGNFKSTATSIGVRSQLMTLSNIIKTVDPKLHEHIENLDGGEYLFAFRMLMVLFRREFSFVDTLYLWELMWSMEYNPNLFTVFESSSGFSADINGQDAGPSDGSTLKKCGRFEKRYLQAGQGGGAHHPPLSIFLVASVLEFKNKRLMQDAKGLDDVVKILNDITGSLDAKKACKEALKIHKKYLNKVKTS
ncbi:Ypt/Rab-GAP domain of gyp1p superfamily protein [Rhynchospora pubera]|uniref:Ypt/Rab-GAP domain of gyp1p superfamily protein n=1 Tax=Rhynchospora pubera TaxID=906938 RepID=A0AAV8E5V5_9POAL|nr:Ypt/Rab-GAP domain of gyp1p superfamily protein [Rhynchospora pubera]KAJ4802433.1 Ypt/Rab-GAP domain of gyp1p superfamily protein [Rhynchospora pubera]